MSSFVRSGLLFSLSVVSALTLMGQEPITIEPESQPVPVVQLEVLVKEMLEHNSNIRAAQHRFDAATKRPSQLSALPEPTVSFTNFGVGHPVSGLSGSDFAYYGFGLSQEIPYPGKLALAGEQARKEAETDRQMYRSAVRDATAQLKMAYYEWGRISKTSEITRRNRDLLQQFEQIARARYEVGKAIQQDVLRAQVEQSTVAQQLEMLAQREETIKARISALLQSEVPLGKPENLTLFSLSQSLEALLSAAEGEAPRLKARQAIVDSRGVGMERAKKEYRPDFGVNFQWQKTGSPFPDYYMATVDVKLPLYFWRKQRLAVEEAAARLQEARQDYLADRQELIFQIKSLFFAAKTSERLLELYDSGVIPQAKLSLESALAGYQSGSIDFLTLLNNFTTVLTFETQYYEELTKHAQAKAQLEALVVVQP